jgi:preprotein translocase subunit SecA
VWELKKQLAGEGVFEQALRFVALNVLDELWMEHLDTMDHLRDSVRLRGYGQRDPLVEYRKEGYQSFKRLSLAIDAGIVSSVFKIHIEPVRANSVDNEGLVVDAVAEPLAEQAVETVATKAFEQIAGADSQVSSENSQYKGTNRNDPCPCGSGKKYKKCHGK